MPEKYTVPQFIDVEDKILGPITVRQFVILLAASLLIFLEYKLLVFGVFLGSGIPTFLVALVFAFVKINGQPFHFFVLNVIETLRRPKLKVWDKERTTDELRIYQRLGASAPPAPPPLPRKEAPTRSKLSELSLMVNTGGVYRGEE